MGNSCSATQEIPSILWKSKVYYRAQEPVTGPILSQMNPVHTLTILFSVRCILITSSRLGLDILIVSFLRHFPTRNFPCASLPYVLQSLPYHPSLTVLTIFGEEHKLCTSPLSNFLEPPVTSSLSNPKLSLRTLSYNNCSTQFTLTVDTALRCNWTLSSSGVRAKRCLMSNTIH
jgi:hypothetical protein